MKIQNAAWWADAFANQVRDAFNEIYESCALAFDSPDFLNGSDSLEETVSRILPLYELASLEVSLITPGKCI